MRPPGVVVRVDARSPGGHLPRPVGEGGHRDAGANPERTGEAVRQPTLRARPLTGHEVLVEHVGRVLGQALGQGVGQHFGVRRQVDGGVAGRQGVRHDGHHPRGGR
ncbi:hypothetical protein SDC9_145839 [bioreactor metagenome]|uniref:Uncharacterized protein n=1 Tax=bioreactor metagenome TaxID=1076179 RepID=A0A645EBE0_9ZZZZ